MDLETAQRIERLEYLVEMLCRQAGIDPDRLMPKTENGRVRPAAVPGVQDAVPSYPGYSPYPQDAVPGYSPYPQGTVPQDAVPGQPLNAGGPWLPQSFYDAMAQGKKIQAIKIYREVTGVGLKEAKDFVDRFR